MAYQTKWCLWYSKADNLWLSPGPVPLVDSIILFKKKKTDSLGYTFKLAKFLVKHGEL